MKIKCQGNVKVQHAQLQRLGKAFELLEMKVGEMVTDYIARVMVVAIDTRNCGEDMTDTKIVEKIMRTLTKNYDYIVCSIKEAQDTDKLTIDVLQSSLLVHEQKLLRRKGGDEQALKITYDDTTSGRGRG
ncbi:uncharacterized protein LOC106756949 [Vigna radiata var. radiata]|uniref:Uncharacterized protein LOC106756949 n=1 Tax=Vigna radiata var. radiata TaxID=3916 RepID=A0A1S3TMQ2_VIGRR|nr:uncharacterized protein LOC106756949 [Vigna radiata var. radiata]